jgi:hypothetical protein
LRREPDVLQKLLSSTPTAVVMDSNSKIDNEKSITKTNLKKRERKENMHDDNDKYDKNV